MEVSKSYFQDVHKFVNQASYNNVAASYPSTLSMLNVANIRENLVAEGFAVVKVSQALENNAAAIRAWLTDFLMVPYAEKESSGTIYTEVKSEIHAKFYVNSSFAQPMHTDEGYTTSCPRYAALYCVRQDLEGGDSILVKFAPLFELLKRDYTDSLSLLFERDAIVVDNAKGREQKSVLYRIDNEVGISYSPVLKKMWCSKDVFMMFDRITTYVHNANNQIRFKLRENEILILDNARIIHGRTRFSQQSERLLYRYWFGLINHA